MGAITFSDQISSNSILTDFEICLPPAPQTLPHIISLPIANSEFSSLKEYKNSFRAHFQAAGFSLTSESV